MFNTVKKAVRDNFDKLAKNDLFYVEIDREKIWEAYISGFSDEIRQEFDCNSCRSFLRQYGGVVAIVKGKMVSIWDVEVSEEYQQSFKNLQGYIYSLPITDVFLNPHKKCGTNKNVDKDNNLWEHFYVELPAKCVSGNVDSIKGDKRGNKQVLKRSLKELTMDAVDTVLEIIAQGSLYRGKEFEPMLKEFRKLQTQYKKSKNKDNFCWEQSLKISPALSKIRNTSIGTLLIDLSEGMELDKAVGRFEKVVAPANYKRPTALVTPRMVEDAKKTLQELELLDSLERRYARATDLNVEDIIFVDKSTEVKDIFDVIAKESVVNPKKFSKVEEIQIDDFIEKVVPTSNSIEVLVENRHFPNFVSLFTAQNPESKQLFKWNNPFSWAYSGSVTDSLKEKVAKLGGRVDGVFRFSHSWNEIEPNQSLMDLHVFMPGCKVPTKGGGPDVRGRRVGWNQRTDYQSGGTQDVDHVEAASPGTIPVENITFPNIEKMPEGKYTCKIHNWQFRGSGGRGVAELEVGGEVYTYEYPRTKNHQWITVAEVTLKDGEFSVKHILPENTASKEKWGVKSLNFVKVKSIMFSPNYWREQTGNKHYIFTLEGVKSDEKPRAIFNEYLSENLSKHRKVLELVGSKSIIEPDDNQLSGLGFSDTQRNSLMVKVQGKTSRILKINF